MQPKSLFLLSIPIMIIWGGMLYTQNLMEVKVQNIEAEISKQTAQFTTQAFDHTICSFSPLQKTLIEKYKGKLDIAFFGRKTAANNYRAALDQAVQKAPQGSMKSCILKELAHHMGLQTSYAGDGAHGAATRGPRAMQNHPCGDGICNWDELQESYESCPYDCMGLDLSNTQEPACVNGGRDIKLPNNLYDYEIDPISARYLAGEEAIVSTFTLYSPEGSMNIQSLQIGVMNPQFIDTIDILHADGSSIVTSAEVPDNLAEIIIDDIHLELPQGPSKFYIKAYLHNLASIDSSSPNFLGYESSQSAIYIESFVADNIFYQDSEFWCDLLTTRGYYDTIATKLTSVELHDEFNGMMAGEELENDIVLGFIQVDAGTWNHVHPNNGSSLELELDTINIQVFNNTNEVQELYLKDLSSMVNSSTSSFGTQSRNVPINMKDFDQTTRKMASNTTRSFAIMLVNPNTTWETGDYIKITNDYTSNIVYKTHNLPGSLTQYGTNYANGASDSMTIDLMN